MTKVSVLSLYPDKATRVKYEVKSLRKAGYHVEVRKPFISSTPIRPLSLLMRYLTLFVQGLIARGSILHYSNIPDFPALALLFRRKKIVYDVRTGFATNMYFYSRSILIWKIAIGIEKLLYRKATVTVVANRYMGERAKALGAKHVVVVPNYPQKSLTVKIESDDVRRSVGVKPEDKVFLIVSVLTRLKPFETLFLKFKEVEKAVPNSKLWVIGDGADRKRLERRAAKISTNIMFLGYKQIEELGSYINASDVCLAIYGNPDPRFQQFYSQESVWKTGEYALFEKPIVALNMMPDPGIISATEDDLGSKMIEALSSDAPLLEKRTWDDSEKILLDLYKSLES